MGKKKRGYGGKSDFCEKKSKTLIMHIKKCIIMTTVLRYEIVHCFMYMKSCTLLIWNKTCNHIWFRAYKVIFLGCDFRWFHSISILGPGRFKWCAGPFQLSNAARNGSNSTRFESHATRARPLSSKSVCPHSPLLYRKSGCSELPRSDSTD